jgi:heme-degrading monooxygenase HmoA
MIVRTWKGWTPWKNADAYVSFLEGKVFKDIRKIDGYRGAYVFRSTDSEKDEVEFFVITFWDSIETIKKFAGDDPSLAVVENEAKRLLSRFEKHVKHYDVVHPPG